jgi:fructoselysine-6-P-deglycase FrlB-like protein
MNHSDDTLGAVTVREIASQPEMWSRAITDPDLPVGLLPADGEPVLVIGCGTSFYIGDAWAHLRTGAGRGRTRAAVPSQLTWVDPDETILLLSRSGTTHDVEQLGRRLHADHRVIGLIGTPDTPIERVCDDRVLLDFADEQSVVQTRFATTGLALLRRAIGAAGPELVDAARRALAAALPLEEHDHLVFLGTGWSEGLAHEAALKCLEASGTWSEAYAVREYQHGPIAAADERTLVWSLAAVEDDLREAVARTGAALRVATDDPMAELILAQRVAVELARRRGRDPDHPAHLSRSVTLA